MTCRLLHAKDARQELIVYPKNYCNLRTYMYLYCLLADKKLILIYNLFPKVSERLLEGRKLEFYTWAGDAEELLKNVREKLNMLGEVDFVESLVNWF